jgi:hypothetical protein
VIVMSAATHQWVSDRLAPDPLVLMIDKPFDFKVLDPQLEEMLAARAAQLS